MSTIQEVYKRVATAMSAARRAEEGGERIRLKEERKHMEGFKRELQCLERRLSLLQTEYVENRRADAFSEDVVRETIGLELALIETRSALSRAVEFVTKSVKVARLD